MLSNSSSEEEIFHAPEPSEQLTEPSATASANASSTPEVREEPTPRMAAVIGNIGPFDDNVEQWSSYSERFDYFVQANGIANQKIVPTFLAVMGPKTFNLLRDLLQPTKPGEKTYPEIVKVLSDHFSPKPLLIAERFRFHKRDQEEGESVSLFVAALRKLAEHCEFGNVLNDTLRDRLVCGLKDEAAQKRLLTTKNLTLDKAISISLSMEMASKEAQQLHATTKVHAMSSSDRASGQGPCYRCGRMGHLATACRCKDMDCRHCGKRGHIERACQSKRNAGKMTKNENNEKMFETRQDYRKEKKKRPVHTVKQDERSSESDESEVGVHTLKINKVDADDEGYWAKPLLEGHPVKMQIDTGSKASIISEKVYKSHLRHLALRPSDTKFRTYLGEPVPMAGMIDVTVQSDNQVGTLPLYVAKGNCPSILGRVWLENLKLNWQTVKMLSPSSSELTAVLQRHQDVFKSELGLMKDITVKLSLKSDARPKFLKARSVPYAIRSKVDAELDALITSGVLEPVAISEWATPIVPVAKRNGDIRICGDFKVTLNPGLAPEQYPLPHIDDLFAGLSHGQKFSKIDLNQAYLQMIVEEESREFLTITTQKGLFRYCRLPFGITSAPAHFQRAMDQILRGLPGVQCYLDDILCTGATDEEHLRNLDAVLQRLQDYGLRVRKDKCEFFKPSVEYLGHVIDARGLHTAPSKSRAIADAPPPQSVAQLRSFLGLLNYYGRFIPNLATILKPLHSLLCKGKPWHWSDACQKAFQQAKDTLLKSGALTHFDPSLPIQLACDASPYGVGAVISHILPNGEEKPIAFASRTLNKAESNYAQIEREALSIVFGVRRFHQYLYGRRFTLLTDHRPLTTILGPHSGIPSLAASRMQRWALLLSGHSYEIKYRKADRHQNVDGLSRLPLPVTKPETNSEEVFYFSQVEGAPVTAAQVKRATRTDPVLAGVMDMVAKGHYIRDVPGFQPYLSRRMELSIQSGCLLWGRRVVIPPTLRKTVLQQLHAGHSGIVRMKELARSFFWWPGVDREIENAAKGCQTCKRDRNTPQLAPLHPWEFPEEPWQRVHVDFAGPVEGKMLLVAVDAHSKWPEVAVMKSTTAVKTIEKIGEMFSRFGCPMQLVSDNGPQLVSELMSAFLQVNGVQHIKSAPFHPATNGLAERFVQTLKHALKTSEGQGSFHQRLHRFLFNYRNTPHATTKVSPASLMFKRDLRTHFDLLKPAAVKDTVQKQQEKQIQQRKQTKEREFSSGDHVLARNYSAGPRWVPATIVAQTGPVSYTLQTADGRMWRRHVDQLLQSVAPASTPPPMVDGGEVQEDDGADTVAAPGGTLVSEEAAPDPLPEAQMGLPPPHPAPLAVSPSDSVPGPSRERRYPERERRPPKRMDL